ncbi:MAG: DNA-binding protein [Maricaulis sp.]|jgi:phage repressor protein C with HTH and peptisase S24 domain|nr:DNA-binding protein [Maricaulis sp.]HAQ34780.1 DNA-binding protein [Alphaproteobacteria bacterium]
MLTHIQVWRGVDRLAARAGLTPSGLARMAGLDPTTFNPSKRTGENGTRLRWPSTESLSKALAAARVSFEDFAAMATGGTTGRTVPLIGLARAGERGFFDDSGFPVGQGWREVHFPGIEDPSAYALEISGDSMQPVYREGDVVVVSPDDNPRRGDRVVVKTRQGEVMAKRLERITSQSITLASFNPDYKDRILDLRDVAWMSRIVWASQ